MVRNVGTSVIEPLLRAYLEDLTGLKAAYDAVGVLRVALFDGGGIGLRDDGRFRRGDLI